MTEFHYTEEKMKGGPPYVYVHLYVHTAFSDALI